MSEQPGARPASTPVYIAVVGPASATPEEVEAAGEVGKLLAERSAVVVCGGKGGVMEAACKGAYLQGGVTLGLLPGRDHGAGNGYLTVEVPTGLGQLRNGLVVGSVEAVIAIGGSWGTMSEISLAMRVGTPTFQIGGWRVTTSEDEPVPAVMSTPGEAVNAALSAVHERRRRPTGWGTGR